MKRTLAGLLVWVLSAAVVLSACGTGGNTGSNTGSETSGSSNGNSSSNVGGSSGNTGSSGTSQSTAEADPDAKYDPPIEITTVATIKPPVKFPEGDDYDNNVWTRAYLENYGIRVKHLWVVDRGQKDQKMNLMLASGELPDFMEVTGVQFKQLIEAGQIEDLTQAYETYASESVVKILNEGGPKPLLSATVDGKLMGIPFTQNPKENAPILWIRTDWLNKLGLQPPETIDDVVAIAEAFATGDPDGNGSDDTFGLLADNTMYSLSGFLNGSHAYMDIWVKDGQGNLAFSGIQPEMKAALARLHEMYKDGLLDPEFAVKNYEKASEFLANSRIGMFYGNSSGSAGGITIQTVRDNDPNAEFKGFPLVSIDSDPARPQAESAVPSYWVVRKGYEHPEAILKMLDFWVKTFYENTSDDIEDQYISSRDGNQPWYLNNIAVYRSFRNVDIWKHINEYWDGKLTKEELTPAERGNLERIEKFLAGDQTFYVFNAAFGEEGGRGVVHGYIENDQYQENEFYTTATPTMTEKWSTLLKIENEAFINIITGNAPVDSFDSFVDSWKKAGGEQITKEVNDWFASVQ